MATVENNQVVFKGGEAMPAQGTEAYKQAQAGVLPTAPVTPTTTPTPPTTIIPASSLTPTIPYKMPEKPVSTAAEGITGAVTALTENAKAQTIAEETAQREKEATVAKEEAKSGVKAVYDRLKGVLGTKSAVQEEFKVAEKTQKYNDVTTQLEASQRAQTNELRALEGSGLGKDAINRRAQEINRKYAFEQADLALIQSAANRDMLTASQLAKDKIEMELEPLKLELEMTKLFYEDNKDDLSDARKDALQAKIAEDERIYNEEKTKKELLQKTKLELLSEATQNGAPSNILALIQKAETPEAAVAIGGKYVNLLDRQYKQAQISKIYADNAADKQTKDGLLTAVIANPALFNQLTPTDKAALIPDLYKQGFTQFGKPLSDTAVKEISQTQDAILSLSDLKAKIAGNEQYLGPISGLQRYNPYSPARQIQADVDRIRQVVGKALEGGVLRKEDEEKYKKILSTLADTPTTATYKIDALIGDLTRNVDTYTNNQFLAGRNVPQASAAGGTSNLGDLRTKYNY